MEQKNKEFGVIITKEVNLYLNKTLDELIYINDEIEEFINKYYSLENFYNDLVKEVIAKDYSSKVCVELYHYFYGFLHLKVKINEMLSKVKYAQFFITNEYILEEEKDSTFLLSDLDKEIGSFYDLIILSEESLEEQMYIITELFYQIILYYDINNFKEWLNDNKYIYTIILDTINYIIDDNEKYIKIYSNMEPSKSYTQETIEENLDFYGSWQEILNEILSQLGKDKANNKTYDTNKR